jgi:pimeloyl-ACP methyl ester carboxylesterase
MAARGRLLSHLDVHEDCAQITVPTLVVTGERGLDYVVPVDGSSAYAHLIRGAESAIIERTGHLGIMTRPDAFARIVGHFIHRRIGADPRVGPEGGHTGPPLRDTPDAAA